MTNPIASLLNANPATLFAQQQQMSSAAVIQRLLGHTLNNGFPPTATTESTEEQPLDLRLKAKEGGEAEVGGNLSPSLKQQLDDPKFQQLYWQQQQQQTPTSNTDLFQKIVHENVAKQHSKYTMPRS